MTKHAAARINSAAERISRLPEPEKGVESKRADEYVRHSIALDPDTAGQRGPYSSRMRGFKSRSLRASGRATGTESGGG